MEQQQARATVLEFTNKLYDLTAFQSGEITWVAYEFAALAIFGQPFDLSTAPDPAEVQPNHLDWPLGDLSKLGEAVQPEGFRRLVISGDDLASLRPLLAEATAITLWKSGDTEYHLSFKPLLPDEND